MARKTKKHRECHKDDQQKNYGSHTRTKTLNLRKKKEIRERNSVYRRVKVITEICKRLSCSQEISYSLLTVLRTKNLGAQRVDRGQAFHLSTILLKKSWIWKLFVPPLRVFYRIWVQQNRMRNVYISVLIYDFMKKLKHQTYTRNLVLSTESLT